MADLQYEEPKASKVPLISLGARIVTTASLVASIIILKSAKVTMKIGGDKYQFSYNDSSTYEYSLPLYLFKHTHAYIYWDSSMHAGTCF